MSYLIARLWIYLLVAFLVGLYVGWTRYGARRA
jgi:hypothetical protein